MNKKFLIVLILITLIFSIGGVSALNSNDTVIAGENVDMVLIDDEADNTQNTNLTNDLKNESLVNSQKEDSDIVGESESNQVLENITLSESNFSFINESFDNLILTCNNASVNIINCNFINSSVIVNGGCVNIVNSSFSDCSVAITQTAGELNITNNIIYNNVIGVNVTGGSCNLSYNALYQNNIGLIYSTNDIVNCNNWWGRNKPFVRFNEIGDCDICQLCDFSFDIDSWLVLNISQSSVLDYDYWIAGITYYNFTVDLSHNNHGEHVTANLNLNNLTLTSIGDIKERIDYHIGENHIHLINYTYDIVFVNVDMVDNKGDFVLTYGYLTSYLNEVTFTILGENYTVGVLNDSVAPEITYVTPSTIFEDSLTVELLCSDEDAVIFYTLDGSNPAYSSTRLIYKQPLVINETSTLHYAVIDKCGNFQKYLVDTFTTGANTASLDCDYPGFIKQDVYLELKSNTNYPIYYTFDDSNPAQSLLYTSPQFKPGRENTGSNLIYTHPFIIHEPVEIRFVAQDRNDWHWVYNQIVTMTTYNLDNSVNYLRNNDSIYGQGGIGVCNYTGPVTNQSYWSNELVTSSGSAVVDAKGRIVVGGDDGYLYYLNTQGLVIWRFGTTSKIIATPTIGPDGNIYFSNWMNSSLYCLSPMGELLWKYHLGDYNTGISPVFGWDNQLYVITSNRNYSTLFVFKDGDLLSEHILPFISGSTPFIGDDGSLYMVSADHELVIVNWDGSLRKSLFIDSGARHKDYDFGDRLVTDQNTQISVNIGDDGTIYVLNIIRTIGNVHAIDAFYPNGTLKWTVNRFNEPVSGTPIFYKSVLYITGNRNLIAVNASNGVLLWEKPIAVSGNTLSSPLISADELLYVTSGNMVYAFNLSGDLLWKYELTGRYGNPVSFASPTLTDNFVLLVTTNQGIFAFRDVAADFTYEHVEGTELSIQFTDLSTNGSNRYYWTFGDNTTSREQNPVHEYASEGRYRVVLLVDHNGEVTLVRNTTITVVYHDIVPPSDVSFYINNTLSYGGNFTNTQYVSLNATDNYGDVTIYYTVDGSSPLNSSTRKIYYEPLGIEIDTVLNAVAVDSSGNYGNVSVIDFIIADAIKVNSSLIGEIQELLDNAEAGSKFVFSEDIVGANFTINKPLNLITNNATLTGNGMQPVFTFTESAKGSTLNGFNINDGEILIDSTSDVIVRNCNLNNTGINILNSDMITVKDTSISNAVDGIIVNGSTCTDLNHLTIKDSYNNGVWIYQSSNTTLSDSLLVGNGKDQYSSKANQVLVDDSTGVFINGNVINYGFFGIHLYHINDAVAIDNNTIYEGSGDAILLSNKYSNVNITHNLIYGCFNGVNFMGYSENVTIKQNTIDSLHDHGDDVYEVFVATPFWLDMMNYIYEVNVDDADDYFNHRYNGIQVSHTASNFDEGNTIVIDNVIIKLQHRAWESRKYVHYLDGGCAGYGYNMFDGSDSYHGTGGATHYREGKVDMVVDRIGDATFRLRLINRLDDHFLSEIPSFDVTFIAGGFTQMVKFINDSAIADFDVASVVSDIDVIISTEIRKSAHFDMEITEGFTGSNRAFDPGLERGEAWDNPDPVVPKFPEPEDDYKPTDPIVNPPISEPEEPETGYGNGTGDGQGTGNGTGTGDGDGNGSSGSFGTGKNNIFGELNKLSGQVADFTGIGDVSSSEDVSDDSTDGMDRSSEGGSDAGSGETVHAYEVSKVINVDESNWKFVVAVVLFSCIVLCGYAYRKRRGDGGEI